MSTGTKRTLRCAIYTRKSSEEGLEQSFNSLDAQREACEAYVLSQRQEGWRALEAQYNDGGYSGGSMERPALKQLLADIDARKVDVVVVYKVDRLTRSLADFARIKPGTRLIRQWDGQTHQVTVAEEGFEYKGERYKSLSEIARLITGTRWSGPLFFGLKQGEKNRVRP